MNDAKRPLQKIFAVEDEEDIVRILELSLRQVGKFDVEVSRNGNDALSRVEEFVPDLFLLDFMMPEMNGLTLMQELRRLPAVADVPVIFLTAKSQPGEVQDYLDAGAVAVINKPFNPMSLPEEILAIWNGLPD